jgi:hypothetical protein
LVSVKLNELVVSTVTVPKFSPDELASSRGVAATPVPLREIVSGEFGASLTIETVPVTLPEEIGVNRTLNVALLPEASAVGTLRPAILKSLPETLTRDIETLPSPVLFSLMV